ncbi:MAG: hypothetical protein KAJ19_22800 [Gammaproteobacteria bacterium]|nr:hypothetical protein [Gammaproteobacteria bacterium]
MTTHKLIIQTRIGFYESGKDDVMTAGAHYIRLDCTPEDLEQSVSQILDEVETLLHNQPNGGFELISRSQR